MSRQQDLDFSVIVPVFNAIERLPRTMPRIREAVSSYPSSELIVVDNGSSDGSYEWLQEHLADIATVLQIPGVEVGGVRNFGAEHARGQYFCFVDSDVVVTADHLHRAKEVFERYPEIGATGTRYEIPQGATWVEKTWHRLHKREQGGKVPYLSAGNIIVKREAFRAASGFDDNLVTGEDTAFCQRLRRSGYVIYDDPSLVAVHLGNAKTITGFFRKQRWYSLGMFGTFSWLHPDKPVLMTFGHLILVLTGALAFFLLNVGLIVKGLLFLFCVSLIPTISVLFRWWQLGGATSPILQSILLYELFFAARIAGLALVAIGRTRGWQPATELAEEIEAEPKS